MLAAITVLFSSAAAMCQTNSATGTNFFLTFGERESSRAVTPQKIADARNAPESRPAAEDPAGHWGGVAAGFQLSVRFAKEAFKAGEPITAIVLIRNTTAGVLHYRDYAFDLAGVKTDSPVCALTALDEKGKPVPRRGPTPAEITDGPHLSLELNPGAQRRYEVQLDQRFDLSAPGHYTMRARRKVHRLGADGYEELTSGAASITVTAP